MEFSLSVLMPRVYTERSKEGNPENYVAKELTAYIKGYVNHLIFKNDTRAKMYEHKK